jgi:ligand-binding sensor domain-containing protein
MSRDDGKNWKSYFDHGSDLDSNFINFLMAEGPVVFICSDKGLSSIDDKKWVIYKKNDNKSDGKSIIKNFGRKNDSTINKSTIEISSSPSIAHNLIIGVEADKDVLWVAPSNGVSRAELYK